MALRLWHFARAVIACALVAHTLCAQPLVRISAVGLRGNGAAADPAYSYVELFNIDSNPKPLAGWSLQFASGNAPGPFTVLPLTGTIPARSYLLIQLGAQGAGSPLPTPDLTFLETPSTPTASLKLALCSSTAALVSPVPCPFAAAVVDFAGLGAADQRTPCGPSGSTSLNAPLPGAASAAIRRLCDGKRDVGSSADVFALESAGAVPHNLASGPNTTPDISIVSMTPMQTVLQGTSAFYTVAITSSACAGAIVNPTADGTPLGVPSPYSLSPFFGDQWVLSLPVPDTCLPVDYGVIVSVRTANIACPEHLTLPLRVLPSNDHPCKARTITLSIPAVSDNSLATEAADGTACSTLIGTHHGVWYTFVAPATGTYDFTTCGSTTDTDLQLFTLTGCPNTPVLTPLANRCDDDSCVGGEPGPGPGVGNIFAAVLRAVPLTTGQIIHLRVSAYAGQPAGRFQIIALGGACCRGSTRACTFTTASDCTRTGDTFLGDGALCSPYPCTQAPLNDTCSGATVITAGPDTPGDNRHAMGNNTEGPAASCQVGDNFGKSVWFKLTPPATGPWRISACGTPQDTVLQVFTGSCSTLVAVPNGCNDDGCESSTSGSQYASDIPSVSLAAGTPYYIRLSSWAEPGIPAMPDGGPYTIRATSTMTCCRGTTCITITDASLCSAGLPANIGWKIAPTGGGACNAGSVTIPCCYGDFNQNGLTSIDDLFLYINAWLANSPYTVIGGNGASAPTIDDIFRFINAWLAPCQ